MKKNFGKKNLFTDFFVEKFSEEINVLELKSKAKPRKQSKRRVIQINYHYP